MDKFMCWLGEWDWRPLARLIAWLLIASYMAERHGLKPWTHASSFLCGLALTWLFFLGSITHLIAIVAMGVVRAALCLDEAAYSASERMTRPLAGAAPFAVRFAGAFAVEVAMAGLAWRHGPSLLARLAEVLR